jgi:hypothetical protein
MAVTDAYQPFPLPIPFHASMHAQRNDYDACLDMELGVWETIVEAGFDAYCCPDGRKPYLERPWVKMPDSGRRFRVINSVVVGDQTFDSSNVVVTQMQVPIGYDGVIDSYSCGISGATPTGFVEGSGTLLWRLAADATRDPRFLRDLGQIRFSLGSLTVPVATSNSSLRIYSGNLVTFFAVFDSSGMGVLNNDSVVVCSISGWVYSR